MIPDAVTALAAARLAFPALALLALWWLGRRGTPRATTAAAVAASVALWAISTLPLARPYAAGPSHDRLGNLAMAQVVAAGNPAWQTPQPGQWAFEPFWGLFVALLSGFDPERVLAYYDWLPLIALIGFPLALWRLLACLDPWERAVVIAFATLLCASPFDFHGSYRSTWAMTFLLKPNHALGLVVFPFVLDRIVRARGWRDALLAGAWLQLLAWVFVLHMVYVAWGLLWFAAGAWLLRLPDRGRDGRAVMVAIGVNALVVSPYIVTLVLGYPFLTPSPRMAIPASSPHLLETTARTGGLFALALWGGVVLARRGDRISRILLAQGVAALALWTGYLGLGALQMARERDEIYYWTRLWEALFAGFGAWDLATRAAVSPVLTRTWPTRLREALDRPPARASIVLALALPWSVPYFWDPVRMDRYFAPSLSPLSVIEREPTEFLRRHTPPDAVIAGDHKYARWVGAFGARRVLIGEFLHNPADTTDRVAFEAELVRGPAPGAVARARQRWGVSHLLATPGFLALHTGSLDALRQSAALREVHFTGDAAGEYVAIFELAR